MLHARAVTDDGWQRVPWKPESCPSCHGTRRVERRKTSQGRAVVRFCHCPVCSHRAEIRTARTEAFASREG